MHDEHRFSAAMTLLTFVLTLAVMGASAAACEWDRDTLGIEARGMPGVAEIITGRFERQPPLYYEMRLARVAEELKASPHLLGHYDDAGVACDRLGRGDEAIAWMAAKKKQLDAMGESDADYREHFYRYHANLGTFHAHRWIRNGKNRDDLADMKLGRELIAKAIEINPDAHFGREKYQLAIMEWIIDAPADKDGRRESFLRGDEWDNKIEAVRGLTGLIALGHAWQSVDVFETLGAVLVRRRDSYLGALAEMRVAELRAAGYESLHPQAKSAMLSSPPNAELDNDTAQVYFHRARAAADRWHEERTRFMQQRLEAGQHPDTHPGFWDGYVEVPAEPVPGSGAIAAAWSQFIGWQGGVGAIFVFVSASLVLFKVLSDWVRRKRLRREVSAR